MLVFYASLADSPEEKSLVEQLYLQYKKLIKYVALSRLSNEQAAEDALHEVMLAVIVHAKKLRDRRPEEIKGFVFLVTRNVCNDILRKESLRQSENIDELWQEPQTKGDPQEQIGVQFLMDCIAALPTVYRDPLELTACYGFTAKEAAELLHISPAACRKRLERARALLREQFLKGEERHG